jgi:mannose/fructose-specific phosphotransferase system component IIA
VSNGAITPNKQSAATARAALERRRQRAKSTKRPGGTRVGVARARDISNRRTLPAATVQRVRSFFARHDTAAERAARKRDPNSPAAIAWDLWGGDPFRLQLHNARSNGDAMSYRETMQRLDEEDRDQFFKMNLYEQLRRIKGVTPFQDQSRTDIRGLYGEPVRKGTLTFPTFYGNYAVRRDSAPAGRGTYQLLSTAPNTSPNLIIEGRWPVVQTYITDLINREKRGYYEQINRSARRTVLPPPMGSWARYYQAMDARVAEAEYSGMLSTIDSIPASQRQFTIVALSPDGEEVFAQTFDEAIDNADDDELLAAYIKLSDLPDEGSVDIGGGYIAKRVDHRKARRNDSQSARVLQRHRWGHPYKPATVERAARKLARSRWGSRQMGLALGNPPVNAIPIGEKVALTDSNHPATSGIVVGYSRNRRGDHVYVVRPFNRATGKLKDEHPFSPGNVTAWVMRSRSAAELAFPQLPIPGARRNPGKRLTSGLTPRRRRR